MRDKTSSPLLRLLAIGILAVSAVPMVNAWRAEQRQEAPAADLSSLTSGVAVSGWTNPRQLEVQVKPGTDDATLSDIGQKAGVVLTWNSPVSEQETDAADATLPDGVDADAALRALRSDDRVVSADVAHIFREPEDMTGASPDTAPVADEPDGGLWKPNDPRYPEQWNFRMVKAEEAWDAVQRHPGKGAVVAVIDTGVAYSDTRKGKRGRDFGDTRFTDGYDFVNHDAMPNDDNGHGTHVAGTIAESTDNNEGVAGLAFDATIMPVKVLSASGSGTSANIAEAIRWAADHGANVINMSLGSPFPDKLMESACEYAHKRGVTIVCAAGNSAREGVGYPAAYKDCIAVSAVGPNRQLSYYSSWGKQVAIAAPGGDKQQDANNGGILQNTVLANDRGEMVDDYYAFQGTSMASPHVAAVAALIEAQGVKDPDDVRDVLQRSAQKAGPKEKYGAGIVDAASAVKLAGNVHGDGVARFWMVVALFTGCYFIGRQREKSGSRAGYPFWGTAALAFGLLFPDWLTGFLGMTSHFNLIAHSVLVPGALLLMGADRTEKRMLGWMALGMTLHVGWEFLRGTAPVGPEIGTWQLLPWVAGNVVIGFSLLISGLSASRD